ncbi:polycystic kidney disease protein 1-like 2 [Branchiostoma floridae]|uniref:Polycystic kidney disease protein 1-like 2 n=1 Tax=Branchiostoma floridae TaxID=7739 RepID=A0A9J7M5W9_BRAFL|nr:polycystic kidney disease protein 1-like 2 [Branchiostoma floridae]
MSGVCSAGCQDGWKTQICNQAVDPPINLVISDVTDKELKITWSPSPDHDLHGYRVAVSQLGMATAVNHYTDQTSFPVLDLSPDSDYVVAVTSLFLTDGWWSQSETVVIHASTEMSSATDLQFTEVTESTLGFTWVPPDAVVTGYRVMYGLEEATEQLSPSPGPADRSAVIEGLQAGVLYKVEIITIGVRFVSLPLVGHNATEMSSATDLQFTEVTESTLGFTWVPPDAVVTGYRVMYGQGEAIEQLSPSPGSADRSAVIEGLQAGTTYKVEIITIGVQRESPPLVGYNITEYPVMSTSSTLTAASTNRTSLMTTFFISHVTATTPAKTMETTSTRGPLDVDRDQSDEDQSDDSMATSTSGANTKEIKRTSTVWPGSSRSTTADQALGNGLDEIFAESVSPDPHDVLQRLAQNIVEDDRGVDGTEKPTTSAEERAEICRKALKRLGSETGRAETPDRLQVISELTSLVIINCPEIPQENALKNTALDVLQSITSKLDKVDMSDPSTVESVGGSLVESVDALLYEPEPDVDEHDGNLQSEDDSVSPEECAQKAKQEEEEKRAEKKVVVRKSRQVLDDLFNAITAPMRPGGPPVTIRRGGVTLRSQKLHGGKSGSQVVQTEEGGSCSRPKPRFSRNTHLTTSLSRCFTQYEQNTYTWGSGQYQARSSVMELSLHRKNYKPLVFNNLTEDFIITIPGNVGNKPATTTITFPAPGNQSSSYHLLNLNNTAEGFLVTITPLNTSVVYGVSGRYGGRPDDQNYDVCTETFVLPEECSLMESLSAGSDETDKSEATMFVKGKKDPVDYYVKVQVLGPETKCDISGQTDEKKLGTNDVYAYQIQWVRLSCVFWSETQEDWRTDGCTISDRSTITSTICHCNHLTAFGSDFATPPNTVDFGALTLRDLRDNGAVLTTIFVVYCLFLLVLVMMTIFDLKSKRKKNPSIKLDDLQNDFRYRLHLWTGAAKHAGTESTVAFTLHGDAATSGVRVVNITKKVFTQGSLVTLTFSTAEQLGNLEMLKLMHDNSGEGSRASWHVDRAAVQDLATGKLSYFLCDEWLAADRGDGQTAKTFPVASEQDLRSFGFLFPACLRSNMAEEHLFLSVAIMPEGTTFATPRELTSLAIYISTQVVQAVSLGPFSFTLNTVYTGIMTSITCLPVVIAIVVLFQYSRPSNKGNPRVRDVETAGPAEAPTGQKPSKVLPHWCKYLAWVLVLLSAVGSAVFTVLYSLEWGKEKSERWLSAYFLTFLVDMFFVQSAKVTKSFDVYFDDSGM